MGKLLLNYLNSKDCYCCAKCNAHLSNSNNLLSKAFTGQTGQAFLFVKVVNLSLGEAKEKLLRTGMHIIRAIYCVKCGFEVGWKYDKAYTANEKYKEGKYILEEAKIVYQEY
jgi:Yippee zinc-binding/DNA-binding /Mis18, centromere assembly